jgi:hypothetical protein
MMFFCFAAKPIRAGQHHITAGGDRGGVGIRAGPVGTGAALGRIIADDELRKKKVVTGGGGKQEW